jgi:signal transduction histidine kinase
MWGIALSRTKAWFSAAWLIFAVVNATLVFVMVGQETIPYHLVWASFALMYGFWPWPRKLTWTVVGIITLVTGIPLVMHADEGAIGWSECSEILLMGVIMALLIWHVNRQWAARDRLLTIQAEERRQTEQRETASRFGSHEVRTRLTIARGFAQLIADTTPDPDVRADATVVVTELDKASVLATNLLTLVRVVQPSPQTLVDVDELIGIIVRRWSVTANRSWTANSEVGVIPADPERLEAALDCLLENAIKFTDVGDDIAVEAELNDKALVLKVQDSGAGIPPGDVGKVFDLFETSSNAGDRAGSGLGLAIVRAITEARGGTVAVESTLGVGTCFTLHFPLDHRPPRRRVETSVPARVDSIAG